MSTPPLDPRHHDDDPFGPARPVTPPASARTPSSRTGGRRRRAHPAKWGRRVAAGGASLAVVALTLHLAHTPAATTAQASGAKATTNTRTDDDDDDRDDESEYSTARSSVSSSNGSSSGSSSSSASSSSTSGSGAVTRSGGS